MNAAFESVVFCYNEKADRNVTSTTEIFVDDLTLFKVYHQISRHKWKNCIQWISIKKNSSEK